MSSLNPSLEKESYKPAIFPSEPVSLLNMEEIPPRVPEPFSIFGAAAISGSTSGMAVVTFLKSSTPISCFAALKIEPAPPSAC